MAAPPKPTVSPAVKATEATYAVIQGALDEQRYFDAETLLDRAVRWTTSATCV